jgi:hypothetical protein
MADMDRVYVWQKALERPPGKARFQIIRGILRDYLKEAGVPAASRDFLSEGLINTVGKSAKASALPAKLKAMLGDEGAQKAFAEELQTAYYMMSGKLPKAGVSKLFNETLEKMAADGMDARRIAELKKIGPAGVLKHGGYHAAQGILNTAPTNPKVAAVMEGVRAKLSGAAPTATTVATTTETVADTVGVAGKRAGLLSKAGGLAKKVLSKGGWWKGPLAVVDLYTIGASLAEWRRQGKSAEAMAATGIIAPGLQPAEDQQTSAAFMKMLIDRKEALQKARVSATMQEPAMFREIAGAISGQDATTPQHLTQRIRLGSARQAAPLKRKPEEVSALFDQLLSEVVTGGGAGG